MNLSTVKSIAIPEGSVTALSIGGVKVWGGGSSGGEPAELLSWEGVAYHINKGTYKDVYAIGDMVPLDLGSEGLINMQIAAFDTDILADGSGTAAISWVAKELLKTDRRWNPSRSGSSGAYNEGTGSVGGWEKCELRTYLNDTIKPLIPADVTGIIKSVTKTHDAFDTTATKFTQTTTDDVWAPSDTEVYDTSCDYELFRTGSLREKFKAGASATSTWWLRSAGASTSAKCISTDGSRSTKTASRSNAICLGFCTGKTPT